MLREEIKKILEKAIINGDSSLGLSKLAFKEIDVTIPEQENFGDFSTNVALKLAKELRKSPMEVAKSIKYQVSSIKPNIFEKIEVAEPGFINFWVREEAWQKEFEIIYKAGNKWGRPSLKLRNGKPIVIIDYCGVNIAKPMSVGHLRSTIIGQALYNIFKFSGWKVIGDNHLGDWGKQFGVLIAAYKQQVKSKKLNVKSLKIEDLMAMYVDYTARMKADTNLEDLAKEEVRKLQKGNKENVEIWKKFQEITFNELQKAFKMLGVKFDYQLGESFYNPMLDGIVKDALEKGVAEKSDGATVIFTDENKPPFIIQKSDGAYLYPTTDIATVKYRIKKFKPNAILYVVGNEQTFHFDQLFKSVKRLKIVRDEELAHIKFGMVLGEDMKRLSTREGAFVSLNQLLDEAVVRARKVVDEKEHANSALQTRPSELEKTKLGVNKKDEIAKVVGIGAVKYNDLSQNRQSDIIFSWDKMLNFDGNSAPYLLYTYARLKSIMRKSGVRKQESAIKNIKYLKEDLELKLIKDLEKFPYVIGRVVQNHFPHILAEYLFELASEANTFYHSLPVLKAGKGVKEARLALIKSVAQTLNTGLNLLGIETIEKM